MTKITLAEIVAKWERQLHDLETSKKGLEVHNHAKDDLDKMPHYQRTLARIDMMKEHIRTLQEYALAHAR
ncbi:MAG TPA: hypothetical protein VK667_07380 [Ktedonobacteraceae bacterium]|nr:hypothetical protein [Ktedonobacteraceae bacterium]